MSDLLDMLGSLWGFMLVVTLLAVAAGWSWADIKARPRWRILEDERRYLRNELFGLANTKGATGELGGVRKRIADLEQALAEARGRSVEVEVLRLRIAELERAAVNAPGGGSGGGHPQDVAAIDITDYASKIAALEEEANYLRAGRLTPAEAAKADAERNRLFALEEELEDTQGKLAAAETRAKQVEAQPPGTPPEDLQLLNWRIRYMSERVKYLETETAKPVVAPEPAVVAQPLMAEKTPDEAAEKERSDRLAWRMRYLEQRALFLEKRTSGEDVARLKAHADDLERQLAAALSRAPQMENETTSLKARIVDLEKQLARVPSLEEQVAAGQAHAQRADDLTHRLAQAESHTQGFAELEHDVTRSRWKGRYLEARVRYLEGKVATPQPAPVVQPVVSAPKPAEKPAPVAPVEKSAPATPFRMERPAALSAPRGGAPDDLRLIKGVTGQAQSALNALGVFHFDQLAAWRPAHAAWVDQYLNLRGRIGSERWVEQASALARGESVLENQAG